jgi:hypothetical protein
MSFAHYTLDPVHALPASERGAGMNLRRVERDRLDFDKPG